jgi:hypothetical protein
MVGPNQGAHMDSSKAAIKLESKVVVMRYSNSSVTSLLEQNVAQQTEYRFLLIISMWVVNYFFD